MDLSLLKNLYHTSIIDKYTCYSIIDFPKIIKFPDSISYL